MRWRIGFCLLALGLACGDAWAAYDVTSPNGILRYRRNSGAQTCPRNFKLVCHPRTIMATSPKGYADCSFVNFQTCAVTPNINNQPQTDVYCSCRK